MSDPQVTQIDHVSVIITDVERSRRFYRDLLGLKEIARPRTFDFVVLWFDLGDMHVHLLLKDRPDTHSPRHFALRVADVAAARAYFRANDVRTQETTLIPGADRFFIHDPDGNRIEIIQWFSRMIRPPRPIRWPDGRTRPSTAGGLLTSAGAVAISVNVALIGRQRGRAGLLVRPACFFALPLLGALPARRFRLHWPHTLHRADTKGPTMFDLASVQAAIRELGSTAGCSTTSAASTSWPAASLGLPAEAMLSRRWFYFVPATGEPRKLVHRIEPHALDDLPGRKPALPALAGAGSRRRGAGGRRQPRGDGVRAAQRQSLRLARGRRHHRAGALASASRSCRPAI